MKKISCLLVFIFSLLLINGCSCKKKDDKTIEYVHYIRGGGSEKLDANILWEYSNNTFTKYQVAYTSYVCSDPSVNFINVIYLEITNKGSKEESKIRNISFSTINEGKEFTVGLWGDYKESRIEFYNGIESELLPRIKGRTYNEIKDIASNGYGNYKSIEGLNSDLITSGTVSASNIISITKAIFDYHMETKY